MIIVWLAALGASIVVGLLVAAVYLTAYLTARGKSPRPEVVLRWAARLWVINFLVDLVLLYFSEPALTGPYWGMQWLLWPLLLTGVLALFGGSLANVRGALDSFTDSVNAGGVSFQLGRGTLSGRGGARVVEDRVPRGQAPLTGGIAGGVAVALALVVAIVVNGLISVATTWFDPNAKALAAIPKMVVEPTSAQLPPTDVDHIVLVSRGYAAYRGQQVLAQSGQNLGSTYHTDRTSYILQSVKGHLYWVAPLVYNNVWANIGNWQSPGFVAVDAEDTNAPAVLHTGLHLRYLPDAILNQELLRHVYLSGYTNGDLVDPTLEVDDAWKPYFTISLMQPTRGFTGQVVSRVLLVDPQTGAIQDFAPQDVPAWVDRIIPSDTVVDYLTWWGKYEHAPWFNPSGSGQQVPAVDANDQPQLVYNRVDKPVWLVPMTSSAASDNSSTGFVLFDTRQNLAHFYPLAGLGVTANVKDTFKSNPHNIKSYDVANVQLYSIYGVPTWVCSFVTPNDNGEIFQQVGLVDARHLTGANVIMDSTKAQALADYAQWLGNQGVGTNPSPTGKPTTVKGKIASISSAVQNGTTVYYFQLEGQTRIYEAGLPLSPQLPLVKPGDQITGQYLDTGQSVVTLTTFADLDPRFGPPPAATATP